MKCSDFLSKLDAYIDGEVNWRTETQVKAHLTSCDACRKAYKARLALVNTLQSINDIPVPETLTEEVLAAVRLGSAAEKQKFRLPAFLTSRVTYSVVAACFLLFMVLQFGAHQTPQNDSLVGPEATAFTETTYTSDLAMHRTLPEEAAQAENAPFVYSADVVSPIKYRITFVASDAAAKAVFERAKAEGENAVIEALSAGGFSFSMQKTVIEDYTAAYAALSKEVARLSEGDDAAALEAKKAEMQKIETDCKTAELDFSLESE